jgi:hypothetical protein
LKKDLVAGIEKELERQDRESLTRRHDKVLIELTKLKKKYGL